MYIYIYIYNKYIGNTHTILYYTYMYHMHMCTLEMRQAARKVLDPRCSSPLVTRPGPRKGQLFAAVLEAATVSKAV